MEVSKDVMKRIIKISEEKDVRIKELETKLEKAKEALRFIAAGKRADGTYNRCREACEELAKETINKLEEGNV